LYLRRTVVLDLNKPVVTASSPFMMSKAVVLLQAPKATSCSHEVVSRFGERHIRNCTCCELSKQDLVVLYDVGVPPAMNITC
jgi:hypothetical protein